jgi:hypothetical protein
VTTEMVEPDDDGNREFIFNENMECEPYVAFGEIELDGETHEVALCEPQGKLLARCLMEGVLHGDPDTQKFLIGVSPDDIGELLDTIATTVRKFAEREGIETAYEHEYEYAPPSAEDVYEHARAEAASLARDAEREEAALYAATAGALAIPPSQARRWSTDPEEHLYERFAALTGVHL